MTNKKMLAIGAVAVLIIVGLLTTNTFSAEDTVVDDDLISGATPYAGYIKFDGIDGEATADGYVGWSEIMGFEQGVSKPGHGSSGSSRRRGEAILDDIEVVKELDKASPKIAEAVCKGDVIPSVNIHCVMLHPDAGKITYYEYELTNVMVTSYTIGSEDVTSEFPVDVITLNCEIMKVTYTETDDKGKKKGEVSYTFDVEKGE